MRSLTQLSTKRVINNYIDWMKKLPQAQINRIVMDLFEDVKSQAVKDAVIKQTIDDYKKVINYISALPDNGNINYGYEFTESERVQPATDQLVRIQLFKSGLTILIHVTPFYIHFSDIYYLFELNHKLEISDFEPSFKYIIPTQEYKKVFDLLVEYDYDFTNEELDYQLRQLVKTDYIADDDKVVAPIDLENYLEGKLMNYITPLFFLASTPIREKFYYEFTQPVRLILNKFVEKLLDLGLVEEDEETGDDISEYINRAINRTYDVETIVADVIVDLNLGVIEILYQTEDGAEIKEIFSLTNFDRAINFLIKLEEGEY